MTDIFDTEDLDLDESETYDLSWGSLTSHSEVSGSVAQAIAANRELLSKLSTNQFIASAMDSAVFLRNTLGDADGVVAEHTENIRACLLVVLTEISTDPVSFLYCVAGTIEDLSQRRQWLADVARRITSDEDVVSIGELEFDGRGIS